MAYKSALNALLKTRNHSQIVSGKPTSKSFEYPLQKLVKQIESFKKGIHRPNSNAWFDNYLGFCFECPKAVVEKRIQGC